MGIVKVHSKKNDTIYVYDSFSYWDKEKKAPRNVKRLIGKIDPETGEIVPTGKPGRPRKNPLPGEGAAEPEMSQVEKLEDTIAQLRMRIQKLDVAKARVSLALDDVIRSVQKAKDALALLETQETEEV